MANSMDQMITTQVSTLCNNIESSATKLHDLSKEYKVLVSNLENAWSSNNAKKVQDKTEYMITTINSVLQSIEAINNSISTHASQTSAADQRAASDLYKEQ